MFTVSNVKTYANEANVIKAVEAKGFSDLHWFITYTKDGRAFPVFVGEKAMQRGVHFHFNVVA